MSKYRLMEMTWEEAKAAVAQERVAVLPLGAVEQHGYHLPLGTDTLMVSSVCEDAVGQVPDLAVLLPTLPYGCSLQHIDFPGTVTVYDRPVYIEFLLDLCRGLAHHGFKKILLVNGHGGNSPWLEIVARKSLMEFGPNLLCATVTYWDLAMDVIHDLRESEWPGGVAHACEMETSLMLRTYPGFVKMEKAVRNIAPPKTEFYWHDWERRPALKMMNWMSRDSPSGVRGDATLANLSKGDRLYGTIVSRLAALLKDFQQLPIRQRLDLH